MPKPARKTKAPRSVHARSTCISKLAGLHLTRDYRNQYGLFACAGILYNHESPRRGHASVTRKIVAHAVRIQRGELQDLRLGNLDAKRYWGHARDYVRAMWLMVQQDPPGDFVIASGTLHTVREFVEKLLRPKETVDLVGNAHKAHTQLGWKARSSFEDFIEDMIEEELREREPGEGPLAKALGAQRKEGITDIHSSGTNKSYH